MKQTTKKVLAGIGAVAIAAGLGFGLGAMTVQPQHIIVEKPVLKVLEKEVPVIKYVNVTKEVPVIKEKIVQVPFENTSFEEKLCDRLLYEDLQECKNEVEAEDAAIKLGIEELKDEVLDFLDDKDLIKDDKKADIIKIYDNFEDIEILKSDYDDNEYKFIFKIKVDDDGNKKKFAVKVKVEDGEAEILKAEEL